MTDDTIDPVDQHIKDLASKLEIDVENLVHFTLIGNIELIGEIIPDETDPEEEHLIIFEPIKILRETTINEDGDYNFQQYFIEWNPCMKEPFIVLNSPSIMTSTEPNQESIACYLETVYNKYFPELSLELDVSTKAETIQSSEKKTNIIDFNDWKSKNGRSY